MEVPCGAAPGEQNGYAHEAEHAGRYTRVLLSQLLGGVMTIRGECYLDLTHSSHIVCMNLSACILVFKECLSSRIYI